MTHILSTMKFTKQTNLKATLCVAVSLCVTWFYLIHAIALQNTYNRMTPYAYMAASKFEDFEAQDHNWKGRVLSEWMTGAAINAVASHGQISAPAVANTIAAYNAIGLMCVFLLIMAFIPNAMFILIGALAAMVWSLTPMWGPVCCSMPWDFPAMFFFTLAFLMWHQGWLRAFMVTVVVGSAFKETVVMAAVLIFFTNWNKKHQMAGFVSMAIAALGIKLGITHFVLHEARVNSFQNFYHDGVFGPVDNFKRLYGSGLHSFLFVNAGTLLALALLPARTKEDWGVKAVVGCFWTGQFLIGGQPDEGREFMEIIPMSMIVLKAYWDTPATTPTVEEWNYDHREIEASCGGRVALNVRRNVMRRRRAVVPALPGLKHR